ncbi:MAG: molybdopterin-dependent oxidoreductase, partial [Chloroflexota bacterium]
EDLAAAEEGMTRRGLFIRAIAGSLGLGFVLWGLGVLVGQPPAERGSDQPLPGSAPPAPPVPQGRPAPAPGTRPEVTATDKFYRVDINLRPVQLDAQAWRLELSGLFARPGSLTLSQLKAYPAVTEARTLSCISNPVGGDLISNAYFTGLRLRDLLQDRGLSPDAKELYVKSADGFYETITLADMQDPRTLLVYGMNGVTLPDEHGFPLRFLIPDRYGMKQPKWIVSMEAKGTQENRGYWPERDWSEEALVQITSVIDTYATDQAGDGRVPIGGIAWTGAQGVQKVEVQVDGGDWREAQLIAPPLGPLTWVLWRFDWPRVAGTHNFRSRTTDSRGNVQIEPKHDTRPDGATGYDYKAGSF